MLWRTLVWMLCGSLALAIPAMADLMIYPAKGQSQAQQDKDRYECHTWAVSQTGYDPSKPPPAAVAASPPAQRRGALRGAARGAAAGAAVGAIAGDAGKGAAAGAAGGGVLGAAAAILRSCYNVKY